MTILSKLEFGWFFSVICHTIVKFWVPPGSIPGHKSFINYELIKIKLCKSG